MTTDKLHKLKAEKALIEQLLIKEMPNSADARAAYESLKPYFVKIDAMQSYKPLGRIRLERLFLESNLSKNIELFNCYGRFANLVEGISI